MEVVDPTEEDQQEDGATADLDAARKSKAAVIKTTTRQVYFDCYFFLDRLPTCNRLC